MKIKEEHLQLKDEQLVSRIVASGESELFQILCSRYRCKIEDKCNSLLKDKKLSEELAADILSKTYEKLKEFKGKSSFSSWLYSITYNHCIDYLRVKKKLHYPKWNEKNEMPEIIDETEEDLTDLTYENLLVILDLIHPEEKALLLMKYKDDLSMKQIGQALRISEDAAKMRLKRARARVIGLYNEKFQVY